MALIGLTGKPRCGKTTLANELIAAKGFVRFSFGQPMREMLGALMRFRGADEREIARWLHDDKDLSCPWLGGQTPRRGLQLLGEEWANAYDPDIWVESVRDALQRESLVVVDDVRRPREAALLHELGGVVLRVERAGGVPDVVATGSHAAENHEVVVNAVIENNGSVVEGAAAILACVEMAGSLELAL